MALSVIVGDELIIDDLATLRDLLILHCIVKLRLVAVEISVGSRPENVEVIRTPLLR